MQGCLLINNLLCFGQLNEVKEAVSIKIYDYNNLYLHEIYTHSLLHYETNTYSSKLLN